MGKKRLTLPQSGRHLVGQCPSDNHDITLTRRSTKDDTESVLVVSRSGHVPIVVSIIIDFKELRCSCDASVIVPMRMASSGVLAVSALGRATSLNRIDHVMRVILDGGHSLNGTE